MSNGLRSGQVAQAARFNPQTLRYYEGRGLLAPPQRTTGTGCMRPRRSRCCA
jgi:DNA-binding transcriptional MerR regulator